jgi:hypothetical protein
MMNYVICITSIPQYNACGEERVLYPKTIMWNPPLSPYHRNYQPIPPLILLMLSLPPKHALLQNLIDPICTLPSSLLSTPSPLIVPSLMVHLRFLLLRYITSWIRRLGNLFRRWSCTIRLGFFLCGLLLFGWSSDTGLNICDHLEKRRTRREGGGARQMKSRRKRGQEERVEGRTAILNYGQLNLSVVKGVQLESCQKGIIDHQKTSQ